MLFGIFISLTPHDVIQTWGGDEVFRYEKAVVLVDSNHDVDVSLVVAGPHQVQRAGRQVGLEPRLVSARLGEKFLRQLHTLYGQH